MATRYRSPEDAYKRGLGHILANVPLYHTLPPMAVGPSMVGLDTAGDLSAIEYYFWDGDSWEQVTIGSIEDRYVKVSADDTVAGYLEAKTAQGTGISLSTTGGPGDEDLVIAHAANASAIPSAHHTVFTTAEHGGVSPQGHHVAFVKADADALYSVLAHLHDDRYYTEAETDAAIDADVGTHAALATGVHGVGGSTVASVADITTHANDPDAHGGKVSKSYLFEFPTEDMAVGDFIPENAIRIPATGKHGGITWGTAYARCETVGAGTNTILFRSSTTLTGARTTRATINLGTAREASGAVTLTETDGMYLWVECSAVGGTAPKKVTVQVDCEEAVY